MIDTFAASADHNVLRSLSDRLGTLDRLLADHGDADAHHAFRAYLRRSFHHHLDGLGLTPGPNEPQDRTQRRAVVLHVLGVLAEDPDVVQQAKAQAARERQDARAVDPNLAGTFLNIAARFGDANLYDAWIETYRARKSAKSAPQDNLRYLYTLASFRPAALVDRTLSSIAGGAVPQEAIGGLLGQLLASHHGRIPAWRFLKANWADVRPRVGDNGHLASRRGRRTAPGQRACRCRRLLRVDPAGGRGARVGACARRDGSVRRTAVSDDRGSRAVGTHRPRLKAG